MSTAQIVRASARLMGLVLGVLALTAGAVIVLVALSYRGSLDDSMDTVYGGLESARSAVEAVSSGASSSTDLVSRVRESLEASGEVLQETGDALGGTRTSVDRLGSLTSSAASELAAISERAAVVLGRNSLGATIGQLQQSSQTSQMLSARLDTLRVSILHLRQDVLEVALAVEGLETDMFSTEAAFGKAEEHLAGAAEAAERLSGSGALFWVLAGLGCIVFLAGVHLVLLSAVLAGVREAKDEGGEA
ncbi:MAG: hypothetical protein R6U36_07725 [Candidatus Fermentibacteraceae bacterium]